MLAPRQMSPPATNYKETVRDYKQLHAFIAGANYGPQTQRPPLNSLEQKHTPTLIPCKEKSHLYPPGGHGREWKQVTVFLSCSLVGGSLYEMKIGVCPRVRLEGWLKCLACPFGGIMQGALVVSCFCSLFFVLFVSFHSLFTPTVHVCSSIFSSLICSSGKSHGRRSLVGFSPWGRWVGHDWAPSLSLFTCMHWRRKWQSTPVFLPGESQGRGSLVGCRLWCRTELGTTDTIRSSRSNL